MQTLMIFGILSGTSLFAKVSSTQRVLFVWFDSLGPINNLSVKQGQVFLGKTSTKLG